MTREHENLLSAPLFDAGLLAHKRAARSSAPAITHSVHSLLSLSFATPTPAQEPKTPPPFARLHTPTTQPTPVTSLSGPIAALEPIFQLIKEDFKAHPERMLALNRGRRELLIQHFDRLSSMSTPTDTGTDPLRLFLGGLRTAAQETAFHTYIDELALITLSQALLLKAWSDRNIRPFKEEDLANLNNALDHALQAKLPVGRDGWQVTQRNLYSWYALPVHIQKSLWSILLDLRITDEGPGIIAKLLRLARNHQPQWPELRSYDPRLFAALWNSPLTPSAPTGPLARKRTIFCPTIRDGSLVQAGPASVSWVGFESYPFQLYAAELQLLWWGPSSPPLWAVGNGLEAHSRDQLHLGLGDPRPTLISRISELEACDLAFILEERCLRLSARNFDATKLREQLDQLPYFKKIKSSGTSLGDLQALVALSKLRPGGVLWWAREEALGVGDGSEILNYFLDRAKLISEWDFSAVQHSLPQSGSILCPRYLYLFQREASMDQRMNHRPTRIGIRGQIRSHIEVQGILNDALQSAITPQNPTSVHGNWQIRNHVSPLAQKEWMERWPDPSSHDSIEELDELRLQSSPLASFSTVRASESPWHNPPTAHGLWMFAEIKEGNRRLVAYPLPLPDEIASIPTGPGYFVLLPDPSWSAPLCAYLTTPRIQQWLEHNAERRGERWVLTDQLIKFIPVHHHLLEILGAGPHLNDHATPMPGEWERLASEMNHHPRTLIDALPRLKSPQLAKAEASMIRATLFIRAARAIHHLRTSQKRLFRLVTDEGRIRWKELLIHLPKMHMTGITLHSSITLMGGPLPLHQAIIQMDRVKSPRPGISLATEDGAYMHLQSEIPLLLDMVWEQLSVQKAPTWSELTSYLLLPRRIEIAEDTANDILRTHGETMKRLQELHTLLSECSTF